LTNHDLDFHPESIASTAFVARNATILGDVTIGEASSVLFGAVLRGDSAPLKIGSQTNVQDLCVLHADPGYPLIIGNRVTIGHSAVVHGAVIEDEVLIGIRAIVLNGAKIGKHSIIGAGALVPENKSIPPRSLVMGVPGKIVREITDEDIARIQHASSHYADLNPQYLQSQWSITSGSLGPLSRTS
jgi:carbonic anhydrase/acetyltransferase-like protein (isoleucine patch superfamily)